MKTNSSCYRTAGAGVSKSQKYSRRAFLRLLSASTLLSRELRAQSRPGAIGVSDHQVLLSGSIDLSGPVSTQVKVGFSGAQLFFDQLNQHGGIHGRRVILRFLDDAFDPKKTIANIEKLHRENHTFALFGTAGDAQSAAAIDLCSSINMPLFAPVCGDHNLRVLNKQGVYFVRASYRDEARKILRHALTVGHRDVVVVYQDDEFGKSMLHEVQASAKQLSIPSPGSVFISVTGKMDASSLELLKRQEPTAIILATVGEAFTKFTTAYLRNFSSKPQIYGFSLMDPAVIFRDLGTSGLGIILTQFVPSIRKDSVPVVTEYLTALRNSSTQNAPSPLALEGFVMAKIFAEALRRTGRNLTREGLIETLDKFGSWDVGGMMIQYHDTSRTGSSYVDLAMVGTAGKLVY